MQKHQKQAHSRIELALAQGRKLIPTDLVGMYPVINDWCAVANHDVPHIHGTAFLPMEGPRPILTATVIGIDAMPELVIRCLDGCYRLGQAARVDDATQTAGNDKHKRRIAWPRFQQLVQDFVLKLSDAKDGIC